MKTVNHFATKPTLSTGLYEIQNLTWLPDGQGSKTHTHAHFCHPWFSYHHVFLFLLHPLCVFHCHPSECLQILNFGNFVVCLVNFDIASRHIPATLKLLFVPCKCNNCSDVDIRKRRLGDWSSMRAWLGFIVESGISMLACHSTLCHGTQLKKQPKRGKGRFIPQCWVLLYQRP